MAVMTAAAMTTHIAIQQPTHLWILYLPWHSCFLATTQWYHFDMYYVPVNAVQSTDADQFIANSRNG